MFVKVGSKIFCSEDEIIAISFSDDELKMLRKQPPGDDMFCSHPNSVSPADGHTFIKSAAQEIGMLRQSRAMAEKLSNDNGVVSHDKLLAELEGRKPIQKVVSDKDILSLLGVGTETTEVNEAAKGSAVEDKDILALLGVDKEASVNTGEVEIEGSFEIVEQAQDKEQNDVGRETKSTARVNAPILRHEGLVN